jgi:hypothetical protein
MPTFPVYPGELPTCLNPWNLRHYLLLAYWVFYRPTALKCYLYQIDPDLYRTEGGIGNFLKTFRYSAYRNLYLFIPLTALFLAFSIAGIPTLIYWLHGGSVEWLTGAIGAFIGVNSGVILGIAGGVASGVTIGVASGMTGGVASSITIGVVAGMALGVFNAVADINSNFVWIFSIYGTFSRIPTYLPLFVGSLLCHNKPNRHPITWSESHILPLPFTTRTIKTLLQKSEISGFGRIDSVVSNYYLYANLQKVLRQHLLKHSNPINYLYGLLHNLDLENYAYAPVKKVHWLSNPTVKELFLGEIAITRTNRSRPIIGYMAQLSKFQPDKDSTLLTCLAGLLYVLLQLTKTESKFFDVDLYFEHISRIRRFTDDLVKYPGGNEVYTSYTLFTNSLKCKKIEDIPLSQINIPFPLPEPSTAIRPSIITAQLQLQTIAQDIQSALTMTSRVNQLSAYARANDDLQNLAAYITENTLKPEQTILSLIVEHWTEIIIAASGAIARTEITEPVANPYVAGNPVTGDIFVGRTDILRRIEELWMAEKPPSLVIYGHRRMGKSSILLNLQGKLNKDTILIDFNMQRVGLVDNTAELLHNLSVRLYDVLEPSVRATWVEPEFAAFSSGNVYSAFERFLTQLDRYRNGKRFAIAIDEFELIETQIDQGILEPRLLSYFLGILQTYPWLFFAFAGLHTLEEMTRNYWEPLFAKVTRISVSFLEPAAARQLITQPTLDFNLDYAEDAIELIIQLTAGQPYLIQLICLRLVSYFNDRNFISPTSNTVNQDRDKSFRFSTEDVEAAIQHSEFESNGSAYFRAIWDRADLNQQLILQQLASEDLSLPEIQTKLQLTLEQLHTSIENLRSHDVLSIQQDKYTYCVPLMRRWVEKHKSINLEISP